MNNVHNRNLNTRGRAAGNGVSLQLKPAERRNVAGAMSHGAGVQSNALRGAMQDSAPDRTRQLLLPLFGGGHSRRGRSGST